VADNLVDQANASPIGERCEHRRRAVNMLRVQQSYQAATKMIKVADEMLQTAPQPGLTMLILGRREGDSILIDGGIRIVVVSCDRGGVRIGIEAPST
jgi:hypothetical protein